MNAPKPPQRSPLPPVIAAALATVLAVSLHQREGTAELPYQDIGNVWTVCDGVTGPEVIPGKKYSPAECVALETKARDRIYAGVRGCLGDTPLAFHEAFAYLHFAYNVGWQGFCRSTAAKRLRARDYVGACDALLMWRKAAGLDCSVRRNGCWGLWTRRLMEWATCRGTQALPA